MPGMTVGLYELKKNANYSSAEQMKDKDCRVEHGWWACRTMVGEPVEPRLDGGTDPETSSGWQL